MKNSERLFLAIYSLLIIVISSLLLIVSINQNLLSYAAGFLSIPNNRYLLDAFAILFIIVGLKTFFNLFTKKLPDSAKVQNTDLGAVNITIIALEHLVSKAAKQVRGIKDVKAKIRSLPEGIFIKLRVIINPESSIPMVTQELQETVQGYIERIAGIKVLEIKVLVDYISQDAKSRLE
ncbi:alkaline shock response membrane anchor protein AmaP [Bacillota bacterium LX-D]|nr:alkaline shock response membrane anchor protein AmaP [Bacillota bacterium LX-D]